MTRARVLAAAAVAAGVALFATVRPGKSAHAADAPAYGENTQDVALKRWQTSEATHWRYQVVAK